MRIKPTQELLDRGNALFDDVASQQEVADTLGISTNAVREWFPGRRLTEEQVSERIRIAQYERRAKEKRLIR